MSDKLRKALEAYQVALEVYQEFEDYDPNGELEFSDWIHAKLKGENK